MDNNIPAFPSTWDSAHNASVLTEQGMTLLDYFAAKALPAIISNLHYSPYDSTIDEEAHKEMRRELADCAYDFAAEMLKCRKDRIKE